MKKNSLWELPFINILFLCLTNCLSAVAHDNVVVIPLHKQQRFTVIERQTVTDTTTGLMWQLTDNGLPYTWANANNYCNALTLNSHNNWRLPTKNELKNIVYCSNGTPTPLADNTDCGSGYDHPTIDVHFLSTLSTYWTSNLFIASAWRVDFYNGLANTLATSNQILVRCVRDQ